MSTFFMCVYRERTRLSEFLSTRLVADTGPYNYELLNVNVTPTEGTARPIQQLPNWDSLSPADCTRCPYATGMCRSLVWLQWGSSACSVRLPNSACRTRRVSPSANYISRAVVRIAKSERMNATEQPWASDHYYDRPPGSLMVVQV